MEVHVLTGIVESSAYTNSVFTTKILPLIEYPAMAHVPCQNNALQSSSWSDLCNRDDINTGNNRCCTSLSERDFNLS
jgi:hypothetical protein